MPPTNWTDRRLQKLFQRYRTRYWPRRRRLLRYRVAFGELANVMGECRYADRLIVINLPCHRSDRELRSTLLHEMCHAVAGPGTRHNSPFFEQLEHLLSQGAPIAVGFPENPEGGSVASIPARFVRCRRLFQPVADRRQRSVARQFRQRGHKLHQVAVGEIADEFHQAASAEWKWREALAVIGRQYGFLDIDWRPLPFAEKFLPELRRAYRRGRASIREERALERLFQLTTHQWASVKGLPLDDAARRLSVSISTLRGYLRTVNDEQRISIPPMPRAGSNLMKSKR